MKIRSFATSNLCFLNGILISKNKSLHSFEKCKVKKTAFNMKRIVDNKLNLLLQMKQNIEKEKVQNRF